MTRRLIAAVAVAVSHASCTGVIGGGEPDRSDPSPAAGGEPAGARPMAPAAGIPAMPPGDLAAPSASPPPGTPSVLRRLSRDELIATLESLAGAGPARADLPEDERSKHGALMTTGVAFVAPELEKLKQVVAELAARIAPALLSRSGCALQQQAQRDCLAAWSSRLAEQAFRRPLRPAEGAVLRGLFEAAGESKEDDAAAVRALLGAIFFAPSFLYRVESGVPVSGKPALQDLGAHEIAARLSYLVTLAPPDAELLGAATAGRLKDPAERVRQLQRLARTERGRRALAVLVLEWLGANESKVRDKSERYLVGLGTDFERAIRASAEASIRATLGDGSDPTLGALLGTKGYLGDPTVQALTKAASTGPSASGDMPETSRAGLLMHPYVISSHTKEDGPSPFQIGAFVRAALLCDPAPDPPPDAADMALDDAPAGLSIREDLEYRTSAGAGCQACHGLFATLGYSFLPFDPVGRWMRRDPSGKPWDLAGAVRTRSGELTFRSPGELSQKLGSHPEVEECFGRAMVHFALGRDPVKDDQSLVDAVAQVAKRTRASVPAVLEAIVASPTFVQTVAQR